MATLSAQQQSKSLSKGKKKRHEKPAKISKVVLDNPFSQYWPLLNSTDTKQVTDLLSQLLVPEKRKPKLPWKNLIKLPKEVRKERIKELNNAEIGDDLKVQRKELVIGLNSVTRNIENSKVISCLIAGDVDFDLIVKHLVPLAVGHNIPIFVLENMKSITEKYLSVSTIAMGLKICVQKSDSHFQPLHNLLKNLLKKYPVPKIMKKLQIDDEAKESTYCKKDNEKDIQEYMKINLDNIYCYRMENTYRAFIPEKHVPAKNLKETQLPSASDDLYKTLKSIPIESSDQKICTSSNDVKMDENESDSSVKNVFNHINLSGSDSNDGDSSPIYKPVVLKHLVKNPHRKLKKPKTLK